MTATITDLADRGRRHEGFEALIRFMGVITDSSDPDRAGLYIAGGILAWLCVHRGISREDLMRAMLASIDEEEQTPHA